MNKGYVQISSNVCADIVSFLLNKDSSKLVSMNDDQFEQISNFYKFKKMPFYTDKDYPKESQKYFYRYENTKVTLEIFGLEDEWYYLSIWLKKSSYEENNYKCDQFDGLLDCLQFVKNKLSKK